MGEHFLTLWKAAAADQHKPFCEARIHLVFIDEGTKLTAGMSPIWLYECDVLGSSSDDNICLKDKPKPVYQITSTLSLNYIIR